MDVNFPYTARHFLESGRLATMCILELRCHTDLSFADAKQLVMDAIVAGIHNDLLGGGSQVDLCVLYPDETREYGYRRGVVA